MHKVVRNFHSLASIVFLLCVPGVAQENAWISPAGGNWHDPYWSLGILPSSGQSIYLTNAGSKEVEINHTTAQKFFETLEMDHLRISAPAGSVNALILDKLGMRQPVTTGLVIVGNNGAMVIDRSLLEASMFGVGGSVIQEGEVSSDRLYVGFDTPGHYVLKRGTLLVSQAESIGGNYNDASLLVQEGGTHWAPVTIQPNGEFQLNGGEFTGSILIRKGGTFRQQGGVFYNQDSTRVGGGFLQSGGAIVAPEATMSVPAYPSISFDPRSSAEAVQIGGINEHSNLVVGLPWMSASAVSFSGGCYNVPDHRGAYRLVDGELVTSATLLEPNGFIDQSGGHHLVRERMTLRSSIYVVHIRHTTNVGVACVRSPGYHISGGTLEVQDLSIGAGASFVQDGGKTIVNGTLATSGHATWYGLPIPSHFNLLNGLLIVSNLVISPRVQFFQSGAKLAVQNVWVLGNSLRVTENFSCDGLIELRGGKLECVEGNQRLGQLMISGQPAVSSFSMPEGKCALRFDDSSGLAWDTTAQLAIEGWAGSLTGGGGHRITFGSGQAGLTPNQLSQISFIQPAGLPSGNYSAHMLANGEIVPAF